MVFCFVKPSDSTLGEQITSTHMTSKWPHINSDPKDLLSTEGVMLGSKENTV